MLRLAWKFYTSYKLYLTVRPVYYKNPHATLSLASVCFLSLKQPGTIIPIALAKGFYWSEITGIKKTLPDGEHIDGVQFDNEVGSSSSSVLFL